MKKLSMNMQLDDQNRAIYSITGTTRSNEKRFHCTVCENATSIDGSFSNRGSRLLCWKCAEKHFNSNYIKIMEWCCNG